MMYEEFTALIKTKAPTQKQYELIERVYATHPAFEVSSPKEKAAQLYDLMGYEIFTAMLPVAEEAEELQNKMRSLTAQLNEVKEQYRELSESYRRK